jgi:surfeit locus 1 family protein
MTSQPQKKLTFEWQSNSKILLFSALFLPLLLILGYWQLLRADEKQEIVNQYQTNRQQPSLTDAQMLDNGQDYQYRQAAIQGEADNERVIILDNRVKYGRPGYEVLQAITISGSAKKLLINRGWVPADLDRSILPVIPSLTGNIQLRGYLYRTLKGGYRLDDGVRNLAQGPSRVGWITVERAEQLFGESFYPYQLRLDSDSVGALETGWPTVSIYPEKHTAYAVQWFAMAVTLFILTLIANSNLISFIRRNAP